VAPPKVDDQHQNWTYLYELAVQYDQYKLMEADDVKKKAATTTTTTTTSTSAETEDAHPNHGTDRKGIKNALEGMLGGSFTSNGNFLTQDYMNQYLQTHPTFSQCGTIFDYTNQGQVFKRFDRKDAEQRGICIKFVDMLLHHPKSHDVTILNMANCVLPDVFLEVLARQCIATHGLPKLQALNLESNLLGQGDGIAALASAIAHPAVWTRLQVLKLENQRTPLTSTAEEVLGPAVLQSQSLVVVSLRVRGGLERQQINNTVAHNVDLLRQARRRHASSAGTLKERKRNDTERHFDTIAANTDSSITTVDLVGDVTFLGLNGKEKTKTGAAFRTNTSVTAIQMVQLQLDDEFCISLGRSIAHNTTLLRVVLDSNAISGVGIKALFEGLSHNTSIVEFQIRHQSKTTSSSEERDLPSLLDNNTTLIKLGIDVRDSNVRRLLEKKMNQNREHQRRARTSSLAGAAIGT
jgi:hypothetical protein